MLQGTYEIIEGELLVLNAHHSHKYALLKGRTLLTRLIIALLCILGSWFITWSVYSKSITPFPSIDGGITFSLQECIATSSLFATFGSAVIAVFTLFTNSALTRFHEDSSILATELSIESSEEGKDIAGWRRWPFIPRVSKVKLYGTSHFFGINNASIRFHINSFQKVFPLPTTEADFKEVYALFNYLRMVFYRKKYLQQLVETVWIGEYPVWDCVMDIYRSIVFYRLNYLGVWIGVCFVLQSILFAFAYPWFYFGYQYFMNIGLLV